MLKGCKSIAAVSPTGMVHTYFGDALEVRCDSTNTEHWTIHERISEDKSIPGPLVGIVPRTWALAMVLNQ